MREKFRFDWLVIIFIVAAFFLPWISWGKILYTGFDLPFIYKKTTKISNTVLFFLKKESVYLAFYIYLVPVLSILATLFIYIKKIRTAKILLFLSSFFGFALSLYMYYYLLSSKLFKLSHAGIGLHILCIASFVGIAYTAKQAFKKRNRIQITEEEVISLEQ